MRREGRCRSIASGVVRSTRLLLPADHLLDVPSRPQLLPAASRIVADQKGRRRLAVGAGDPDHGQLGGRVAEEARRERGHRRARVGDQHLGHADVERALDDERRRAASTGGRREVVAVAVSPVTQKKSVPEPTARLS